MHEAKGGKGVGLAIVFGNILDTIPRLPRDLRRVCGLREPVDDTYPRHVPGRHSRSGSQRAIMLRRAGFTNRAIFLLWSTVLVAGVVAAVAGKMFISNSEPTVAVRGQAVASGAILALVTHAMIPEPLHKDGSTVVLPAVGGLSCLRSISRRSRWHSCRRRTQKRRPFGRLLAIQVVVG